MAVHVRKAVPADAAAITALHERSIRALAGRAYGEEVVEAWASGKDPADYAITSDDAFVVVGGDGEELVGFGELRATAPDYCEAAVEGEIRAIYVHPDHTRKGVGSSIYGMLERKASEREINALGLWASRNAVSFYTAQGFEPVRGVTHRFGGDVEGAALEMAKEL